MQGDLIPFRASYVYVADKELSTLAGTAVSVLLSHFIQRDSFVCFIPIKTAVGCSMGNAQNSKKELAINFCKYT